jgi:hypothetical protein
VGSILEGQYTDHSGPVYSMKLHCTCKIISFLFSAMNIDLSPLLFFSYAVGIRLLLSIACCDKDTRSLLSKNAPAVDVMTDVTYPQQVFYSAVNLYFRKDICSAVP